MQSTFLKSIVDITEPVQKATEQSGGNQSIVILITGFAVVFLVLLLLIGVIKIYSSIVNAAQRKAEKQKAETKPEPVVSVSLESAPVENTNVSDDLQTIAVITAAVEAFYGEKKVKIRDIRPVSSVRSSWATAGIMENIPAFRSEGLL